MASNKHLSKKKRLIKICKQNSAVPIWVVSKTKGKFRRHPKLRNWRTTRIKL
ncbi:MAG: 50S ribosomal protein L39e [Candidatus Verstraetearchaeota archaeon]|nr:50S ribosomal protein L39e [Candidatus Verstraetearchaeota archaeon]